MRSTHQGGNRLHSPFACVEAGSACPLLALEAAPHPDHVSAAALEAERLQGFFFLYCRQFVKSVRQLLEFVSFERTFIYVNGRPKENVLFFPVDLRSLK